MNKTPNKREIYCFEAKYKPTYIHPKLIFDDLVNILDIHKIELRVDQDDDDLKSKSRILQEFTTNLGEERLKIEKGKNLSSEPLKFLKELNRESSIHKLTFDPHKSKYTLNWLIQQDMTNMQEELENSQEFRQIDQLLKYLKNPNSLSPIEHLLLDGIEEENPENVKDFKRKRPKKDSDDSESEEEEEKKKIEEKKPHGLHLSQVAFIYFITSDSNKTHTDEMREIDLTKTAKKPKKKKTKEVQPKEIFQYNLKLLKYKEPKYDLKIAKKSESQSLLFFDHFKFGILTQQEQSLKFHDYWDSQSKISHKKIVYGVDDNGKLFDKIFIVMNPAKFEYKWEVKIELNLMNVKELYVETGENTDKPSKNKALFFSFYYPPAFSVSKLDNRRYVNPKYQKEEWERVPNFALFYPNDDSDYPVFLQSYLENNTVFMIKLKSSLSKDHKIIDLLKAKLQDKVKEVKEIQTLALYGKMIDQINNWTNLLGSNRFDFEIRYAFISCLSQGKIDILKINENFIIKINTLNKEILLKTLRDIANRATKFEEFAKEDEKLEFEEYFDELYHKNESTREVWSILIPPKNTLKIRKMILSPSSIQYLIPQIESMNAITHKYSEYAEDLFMRLDVRDDSGSSTKNMKFITYRIFLQKLQKTSLFGKQFRFLGYSGNQLRSGSCWMLTDAPNQLTLKMVHTEIGDLRKIRIPAKFGSRRGQLCSAFMYVLDLSGVEIKEIPDKKIAKFEGETVVEYIFSDGIGKISKNLMQKIALGLKEVEISAVQIRFGGVKGVLAVCPDLKDNTIEVRSSMIKFEDSKFIDNLYVLNYSKANKVKLNRQTILLLSTLGISTDVFLNYQRKYCEEIFSSSSLGMEAERTYFNTRSLFKQALKSGINIFNDPFLLGILDSLKISSLESIKSKANILVPDTIGLIGVLDETETLNYGEVYLAIETEEGINYVEGEVIVTKNPCLHPGDVRNLRARSDPEARNKFAHMKNCLVFPSKGERPHTSEISGSDLDGDIYFISWNKDLIPEPGFRNYPPMKYDTIKPKEFNDRYVTSDDVIRFFVGYINNDQLGRIDNSHLAISDRSLELARDPKSIELAKLHAVAVDYAKSGIPAALVRKDYKKEFAQLYPDYMEKNPEQTYESDTALGILYRDIVQIIKKHEIENPSNRLKSVYIKSDYVYPGYKKYLKDAFSALLEYYSHMDRMFNNFHAMSEFEVFVEGIRKLSFPNKVVTSMMMDKNREMHQIKEHLEALFSQDMKDKEEKEILAKASAWYIASYYNHKCEIQDISKYIEEYSFIEFGLINMYIKNWKIQLFGLPWFIVPEILIEVKKCMRRERLEKAKSNPPPQ